MGSVILILTAIVATIAFTAYYQVVKDCYDGDEADKRKSSSSKTQK